jgi:hypothetical protein
LLVHALKGLEDIISLDVFLWLYQKNHDRVLKSKKVVFGGNLKKRYSSRSLGGLSEHPKREQIANKNDLFLFPPFLYSFHHGPL